MKEEGYRLNVGIIVANCEVNYCYAKEEELIVGNFLKVA